MSCPCIQSGPIATCTQNLTVGLIDDANTEISVYIKNNSTGRVTKFDTLSGADGEVAIDTADFDFGTAMGYEITVTLLDDPITNKLQFTVNEQTSDCIWFSTVDLEGVTTSELTSETESSGVTEVRYRLISADSGWPVGFWVTGIENNTTTLHVTLGDPADYNDGIIRTMVDEAGFSGTLLHRLYGNWLGGDAYKEIEGDFGSIQFYSNGDHFVIKGNP